MSNELAIYDRITDPLAAVKSLGLSIAQSGIFGTANNAQGEVLALECMSRGLAPFTLAERYNIIHNRLSMKAEAMLSVFNQRGGKHREISSTPDRAEIEVTLDGQTKRYSLTWEECRQEPFVYEGKETDVIKLLIAGKPPTFKPKYATPRSRAQMMWARLVSDTIRKVMPSVNSGTYTPEEVDDFEELATNGSSGSNGHARKPTVAKQAGQATPPAPTDPNAGAIEVPFEVNIAPGQPVTTSADKPAAKMADPAVKMRISVLLKELGITDPGWDVEMLSEDAGKKTLMQLESERLKRLKEGAAAPATPTIPPAGDACSAQHADRIKELWGLLNATPAQRDKMLAARNAKTVRNLTMAQASELIGKLEAALAKVSEDHAAGSAITTPHPNSPATPEQCAALRERLKAVAQNYPGIIAEIRRLVEGAGYKSFDELSYGDVGGLLAASYTENIIPTDQPWPTSKADRDIPF